MILVDDWKCPNANSCTSTHNERVTCTHGDYLQSNTCMTLHGAHLGLPLIEEMVGWESQYNGTKIIMTRFHFFKDCTTLKLNEEKVVAWLENSLG